MVARYIEVIIDMVFCMVVVCRWLFRWRPCRRRRAKKKRVKMMLTVWRYDVCPSFFSFPADGVSETSICRIYFRG